MVVNLEELARRMLADYDSRIAGQFFCESLDLTTAQAYVLQAEIARLREQRGEKVIGYKIGCTERSGWDRSSRQRGGFGGNSAGRLPPGRCIPVRGVRRALFRRRFRRALRTGPQRGGKTDEG